MWICSAELPFFGSVKICIINSLFLGQDPNDAGIVLCDFEMDFRFTDLCSRDGYASAPPDF